MIKLVEKWLRLHFYLTLPYRVERTLHFWKPFLPIKFDPIDEIAKHFRWMFWNYNKNADTKFKIHTTPATYVDSHLC